MGMKLGEEIAKYEPMVKELAAGQVDKLLELVEN